MRRLAVTAIHFPSRMGHWYRSGTDTDLTSRDARQLYHPPPALEPFRNINSRYASFLVSGGCLRSLVPGISNGSRTRTVIEIRISGSVSVRGLCGVASNVNAAAADSYLDR